MHVPRKSSTRYLSQTLISNSHLIYLKPHSESESHFTWIGLLRHGQSNSFGNSARWYRGALGLDQAGRKTIETDTGGQGSVWCSRSIRPSSHRRGWKPRGIDLLGCRQNAFGTGNPE